MKRRVPNAQKRGEPSRNPTGKNGMTAFRAVKNLTREEVAEIGTLLLKGTEEELMAHLENSGSSMLAQMMGRVLTRASNRGDHKAMIALIEQIAGKQVQEVKVQLSPHAALVQMVNGVAPADDEDDDMGLTPEGD